MDFQSSPENISTNRFTEVFDAEFKCLYEVPSDLVVHTPSARLNITRLVFCRNYRAGEKDSCLMGDNCKFVHADVDTRTLEAFPIHVNYIWRHEDLCTYKRLPPGEIIKVLSLKDSRKIDLIPSERILVTRRFLYRMGVNSPFLTHCVHYHRNRMCNRGESCNFVHAVYVDPNITKKFRRVPAQYVSQFETVAFLSGMESLDSQNKMSNRRNQNPSQFSGAVADSDAAPNLSAAACREESVSTFRLAQGVKAMRKGSFAVSAEASPLICGNRGHGCMQQPRNFIDVADESFAASHFLAEDDESLKPNCFENYSSEKSAMTTSLLNVNDELGNDAYPRDSSGNGMLRQMHKFFDPPAGGTGLSGALHAPRVSLNTSIQGQHPPSESSATMSPYQGSLRSLYDAGLSTSCKCSPIAVGEDNSSAPASRSRRFYRHNPYYPAFCSGSSPAEVSLK